MKFLKYSFFFSLFLFALSVILTMYSMATDEQATLLGFPLSYFMLPLLLISVLLVFRRNIATNTRLVRIVIIWLIVVPLFSLLNGGTIKDIIRVILWPMAFLASYKLANRDESYFGQVILIFVFLLFVGAAFFFEGKMAQFSVHYDFENSSNAVFCVLSVLPFALCSRRNSVKIVSFVIAFVVTIFSLKRSALLILGVSVIPALKDVISSVRSRFVRRFIVFSLLAIFVYAFFYLSERFLGNFIFDRFSNISEDGGSGRDVIWAYVIDAQSKSNLFEWIIGHGNYAVSKLGDATAAHNDFLEVLYDYGLIVFALYLSIHYYLVKNCIMLHKHKSPFYSSYFIMTVIFIFMSWMSILVVQQRYLIFMAIYWGIFEAIISANKQNLKLDNKSLM